MKRLFIILVCIFFALFVIIFLIAFIQGCILVFSFPSDKKALLDELKKYDEDDYNMVVSHQIYNPKKIFKLIKKLWKDPEIKNNYKTLYLYLKRYKTIIYEMLILVVLMVLFSVIIEVFGSKVGRRA
ncbi:MAG: hypothetical protein IKI90_02475 [Treponema sp.]|nr:hypothetical protein [Treponema sp.]